MRRHHWILCCAAASLVALVGCAHLSPAPRTAKPAPPAAPFDFVQVTDTHHGHPLHLTRTRQAVDAINALPMPIACVLHTGDLASDNLDAEAAAAISNEFARLRAPLFFVPGNHDILPRKLDETLEAYRSHFGPLATRHEVHGVTFLALYTEPLRTGIVVPDYDPLAWLANELAASPDQPTIVVHHAPDGPDFYNNQKHEGWPTDSRERWLTTLARGRVEAIIAGHFHRDEVRWNELGIPTYVASSIASFWGRQASFRIYTYDGGRLSHHTVYLEDAPPAKPE